jgi:hypothetical protein
MLFQSFETNKPHARVISGTRSASRVPTTTETPLSRKAFSSALIGTEAPPRLMPHFYTKLAAGAPVSFKKNLAFL